MALGATIYNFEVELSDVDRGVYESFELKVARHPSETAEYMLTRVLAYALEFTEGIELPQFSSTDEPAVLIKDLTGQVKGWIEVGMPEADRLHRAAKLADHVALYTHRDPRLLSQLHGKKIHRAEEIAVFTFGRNFIEEVAEKLDRRNKLSLSVTERHLYLDLNGTSFETEIEEQRLS